MKRSYLNLKRFFLKHLENGSFVGRKNNFFLKIRQIRKQKHKVDKKLGDFMLIKWIHEKSMKKRYINDSVWNIENHF